MTTLTDRERADLTQDFLLNLTHKYGTRSLRVAETRLRQLQRSDDPRAADGVEIVREAIRRLKSPEGPMLMARNPFAENTEGNIMGPFEKQVEAQHAQLVEQAQCPACGGQGQSMGTLDNREHFRCRNCGADFSKEVKKGKKESVEERLITFDDLADHAPDPETAARLRSRMQTESEDSTGSPIEVGDEVKYSRTFLRNTGQFSGDMAHDSGIVRKIQPLGRRALVTVDFASLGTMKVISANLTKRDRLQFEPR